jgi:PAS domain S-box-containing protein
MSEFFGRLFPVSDFSPRGRWWDYAAAVAVGVLAVLARGALDPLLVPRPTLILPFLGVLLVAWLSGFRPALVTLVVAMPGVIYFFVPPRHSFLISDTAARIDVALFFFGGIGCGLLGEAQRNARRRAEAALADSLRRQDELQEEVGHRTEAERNLRLREGDLLKANAELRLRERRLQDLTEELRASKEQMQTLADSIPQLAWMAEPDGSLFWYNQRWYDYTGTTFEQMRGWGWQSVHDPAELPRVVQKFREHIASGEPWEDTFPLRRHDGERRWFLSRARPVRDESGHVVRWFGTNTDVTQQRQMQEDLRQSAERFRMLMEAMPKLVWTADPAGEVTYFNRRWVEYTGLTLEQGRGGGWRQVIHPDDVEGLAENWATAIRTGEPANYEYRIRRHGDGEYRWHLAYAVPLRDADGRIVQWIGAASDVDAQRRQAEHLERLVRQRTAKLLQEIEERTRAEKLVQEMMTELRRSNGELEQFAYVASHDLQEPLRKIQAFGGRLKAKFRPLLGEQGQDYIDRMQSSAARMQLLINDLLAFSRVSTRGQEFRDVDLKAVARDVISDLEARILQTGADVPVGELPTLRADPLQMRQLLQNLIGNALKFHREGVPPVVEVSAAVEDGVCRLEVSDNGIGFEERYLDRIFQVFQRLHGRGVYEGTGVGLAICKKIAERHGGSITARSTPGQGSTFIVALPLNPTEARTNDRQEQ